MNKEIILGEKAKICLDKYTDLYDNIYHELLNNIGWIQPIVKMFGKISKKKGGNNGSSI